MEPPVEVFTVEELVMLSPSGAQEDAHSQRP
jgi:hypothetical protein